MKIIDLILNKYQTHVARYGGKCFPNDPEAKLEEIPSKLLWLSTTDCSKFELFIETNSRCLLFIWNIIYYKGPEN